MAIVASVLTEGKNTSDLDTYSTASITTTATSLVLAAFLVAGLPSSGGVSNGTRGWVEVATILFDTIATPARYLTVWRCLNTSNITEVVTWFNLSTMQACGWGVVEFSGVDTSGTQGSGAVLQPLSARIDSGTVPLVTLGAFSSANNATYGAFGRGGNTAFTEGSGFTPLATPGDSSSTFRLLVEWKNTNDTTVDATQDVSKPAAGIALEIKAAASLFVPRIMFF